MKMLHRMLLAPAVTLILMLCVGAYNQWQSSLRAESFSGFNEKAMTWRHAAVGARGDLARLQGEVYRTISWLQNLKEQQVAEIRTRLKAEGAQIIRRFETIDPANEGGSRPKVVAATAGGRQAAAGIG